MTLSSEFEAKVYTPDSVAPVGPVVGQERGVIRAVQEVLHQNMPQGGYNVIGEEKKYQWNQLDIVVLHEEGKTDSIVLAVPSGWWGTHITLDMENSRQGYIVLKTDRESFDAEFFVPMTSMSIAFDPSLVNDPRYCAFYVNVHDRNDNGHLGMHLAAVNSLGEVVGLYDSNHNGSTGIFLTGIASVSAPGMLPVAGFILPPRS